MLAGCETLPRCTPRVCFVQFMELERFWNLSHCASPSINYEYDMCIQMPHVAAQYMIWHKKLHAVLSIFPIYFLIGFVCHHTPYLYFIPATKCGIWFVEFVFRRFSEVFRCNCCWSIGSLRNIGARNKHPPCTALPATRSSGNGVILFRFSFAQWWLVHLLPFLLFSFILPCGGCA